MADADDMTECPVCLKTYDESEVRMPRLLPCTHTICHGCLGSVIKGNSLVCTECETKHQAAYGTKTFFQNGYILRLLKIKKEMDDILKAKDQKPVPVSNLPNFSECERHNRLLSLYCKDEACQMEICQICMIKHHKGHEVVDVLMERNAKVEVLTKKMEDERQPTAITLMMKRSRYLQESSGTGKKLPDYVNIKECKLPSLKKIGRKHINTFSALPTG